MKRTTIEIDEALLAQAVGTTGATLRSTVEEGLRLVVSQGEEEDARCQAILDRHLANAADAVEIEVLLSDEAWRTMPVWSMPTVTSS